ncbi:MAG: PEP/pyruvate-binding domain-containing protein [Candidatus Omnitrophica bacterium]|nr:PEP/pyruvate-binding domain-containing protein [Candidatus Omnitrophota bacterium]MDD5352068.1 PEP/pyruvate-binding domain-containing protein [Candidatus Omnitrophota bacterium]MDD5549666.1 PEP/pyruvate-binding domain-containing protein [Candidatus Omnitrophota bacterium]
MISTGIKGLDDVITGLRAGDNVVWQIDDIEDYVDLVKSFVEQAQKERKKIIYIRFASHKELLKPSKQIKRYELNAYAGFESFTTKVNNIITQEGEGTYYVFDCLSELLSAWATDLMIGNFFMVTCPYLYELKTVTYFSILRNNHSFKSIAIIRETTQLLMDVYHSEDGCYIHPLKVWNRYSPTMFLPHQKEGDRFIPITDSVNAVKILSYIYEKGTEGAKRNLDYWDRLFIEAEDLIKNKVPKSQIKDMLKKLCSIMITKNKKILSLAINNFSLEEVVDIKSRLIGTGFIGGKTAGMLLARKILSKSKLLDWQKLSESHDSFYIGSDIFYSYIVQNRWWKLHIQQKTEEGYFNIAKVLKEKMLFGVFSDEIMEHFQQIIEYFGSSPIIIRSSSLLEDGFGNAFAGKYESVFLANQGTPEQRYIQFAEAVRRIYASTMNEDALVYRKQRGLDKSDEQMALLVQRVSGAYHKHYFFPDLAGVGVSYNTYVWNKNIDPQAGMLRLVFGLGTRAVNRVEGDYPRMVALDDPLRRPYTEKDDLRKFSQHEVDLINTKENILEAISFQKLMSDKSYVDIDRIAIKDHEAMRMMSERGARDKDYWILTLDNLFSDDKLADSFRKILESLEEIYNYPVEIEFTVNFTQDNTFKINLLQCRPLQTHSLGPRVEMPDSISRENILFESQGYFLGGNISQKIGRIIYVDPQGYSKLALSDKHEVARIVGSLNRDIKDREALPTILIGPGRWGTTTPSLGVPVKFAEINNVTALAEIAFSAGNLMPELSFGTHFFQDLVETNIFYVALFPENKDVIFNNQWLTQLNNLFVELMPQSKKYEDIISVYDTSDRGLKIISDVVSQKVICFSGGEKISR